MDNTQLKKNMESLWIETFGDSAAYVSLVFDNYFNPATVAYHEHDDKLEAALLGIEYEFLTTQGKSLKGLYLCGLATVRESRRQGIMSTLIEQINGKAEAEGYDFTFLIPADEGMQRYYRDRGYHDSFYKLKEHYVKGHRFGEATDIRVEEYKGGNEGPVLALLERIGDMGYNREGAYQMHHTRRDWKLVIKEALLSSQPVYVAYRGEKAAGVAFTYKKDNYVIVKKICGDDPETENAMLGGIGVFEPDRNITVIRDLEETIGGHSQIWSPFYAVNNSKNSEYEDVSVVEIPFNPAKAAYPMGMVRLFNLENILEKIGFDNPNALKGYSREELFHLILRRPAGSRADALEKILDLPEVCLNCSLLLE